MVEDRAAYEADIRRRLEEGRKKYSKPRMMRTESDHIQDKKEETDVPKEAKDETKAKAKKGPVKGKKAAAEKRKSRSKANGKSNGKRKPNEKLDVKALAAEIEERGPKDGFTNLQREIVLYCSMRSGKDVAITKLLDELIPKDERARIDAEAISSDRKAHRIIRNAIRSPIKRNLLARGEEPGTVHFVKPTQKPKDLPQRDVEALLYITSERKKRRSRSTSTESTI